jgi:hypothetical protein
VADHLPPPSWRAGDAGPGRAGRHRRRDRDRLTHRAGLGRGRCDGSKTSETGYRHRMRKMVMMLTMLSCGCTETRTNDIERRLDLLEESVAKMSKAKADTPAAPKIDEDAILKLPYISSIPGTLEYHHRMLMRLTGQIEDLGWRPRGWWCAYAICTRSRRECAELLSVMITKNGQPLDASKCTHFPEAWCSDATSDQLHCGLSQCTDCKLVE